ncbi:MAG: hypothetical protein LBI64_00010 [Coriobacteriales bacterium]|nr:hypothetical protein [Coriobacteriales bacterium]
MCSKSQECKAKSVENKWRLTPRGVAGREPEEKSHKGPSSCCSLTTGRQATTSPTTTRLLAYEFAYEFACEFAYEFAYD